MATETERGAPIAACDWDELLRGWPRLAEAAPHRLLVVERTASTQALGRELVAAGLAGTGHGGGGLVLALGQSDGRGRHRRRWSSPAGHGVYASLIVDVGDIRRLQRLPLLAGIGLGRALDRWLIEPCRLKWPNDLMVRGRKIGGILIDGVSRGSTAVAIVGFGVNRSQTADDLPPGATSLGIESDSVPELPEMVAALVRALRTELTADAESPRTASTFSDRSAHRPGDRISFHSERGRLGGTFLGIDDDGRLRLEIDGEERRFTSGEVVSRPEPAEVGRGSLDGCR